MDFLHLLDVGRDIEKMHRSRGQSRKRPRHCDYHGSMARFMRRDNREQMKSVIVGRRRYHSPNNVMCEHLTGSISFLSVRRHRRRHRFQTQS